MPNPPWLDYLFEELDNGQIQAGVYVEMPQRQPKDYGHMPYSIEPSYQHTKGTRIPASTISRFRSGEWTPRETSLHKLRNLYERYNYLSARSVGMSPAHAQKMRTKNPLQFAREYNTFYETGLAIHDRRFYEAIEAGQEPPLLSFIFDGMAHSDRDEGDDWEEYISTGE